MRRWLLVLSVLLGMLGVCELRAEEGVRRFVRWEQGEAFVEGQRYLIGATVAMPESYRFALLANGDLSKGKGTALLFGTTPPLLLSLTEAQAQRAAWSIASVGQSITLRAPQGVLEATNKGTALALSAQQGKGWQLSAGGDTLRSIAAPHRFLTLNAQPQTDGQFALSFGAYTAGHSPSVIYIYKEVKDFGSYPAEATMPAEGTIVGLLSDSVLASPALTAVRRSEWELADGSMAQSEAALRLRVGGVKENKFSLTAADSSALPATLAAVSEWQIVKGYIATTEPMPRYLARTAEGFALLTASEATAAKASAVRFALFAPRPEWERRGLSYRFFGGWTLGALQGVEMGDALEIDLSQARLPAILTPFAPKRRANTLVRLPEGCKGLPEGCPFLVVGDSLQGSFTLTDKEAYTFSRPFYARAGSLRYERTAFADGGWETLALPFTADAPKEFVCEALLQRSADGLTFAPTDSIAAGEAVILRYAGADKGTTTLIVTNRQGWVLMPHAEATLLGTADTLRVATDGTTLLLAPRGDCFMRALSGSMLFPFRAYLKEGIAAALRLQHLTTGVALPTLGQQPSLRYDLTGRPASPRHRGVILLRGKKLLSP